MLFLMSVFGMVLMVMIADVVPYSLNGFGFWLVCQTVLALCAVTTYDRAFGR